MCFEMIVEKDKIDWSTPIVKNKNVVDNVGVIEEKVMSEIKKSEISPQTDYLFTNVEGVSNVEKTANKIAIMNGLIK